MSAQQATIEEQVDWRARTAISFRRHVVKLTRAYCRLVFGGLVVLGLLAGGLAYMQTRWFDPRWAGAAPPISPGLPVLTQMAWPAPSLMWAVTTAYIVAVIAGAALLSFAYATLGRMASDE